MEDEPQEEINFERTTDFKGAEALRVTSTKMKQPFLIQVARNNFPYYEVITEGGSSTPIKGYFTSIEFAKKELVAHLKRANVSQAVRRDRMTARREKGRGDRLSEEPDS